MGTSFKTVLVTAAGLAVVAFAPLANAGPIGIGDFSGSESVSTFEGLGLPISNPTPQVIDGNTYTTDDGTLRYFTFAECSGFCIGNNTELGYIDVVLGTAATRVGALVGVDPNWSGRVEFYDGADALLGAIDFTDESVLLFAGWEDAGGIARMRVIDLLENRRTILLDDLRWEGGEIAVPEPAAVGLFGLGLALAGAARRRRRA